MKREITVSYAPSSDVQKPMIRIANMFLLDAGFTIGTKCAVEYKDKIIIITKLEK